MDIRRKTFLATGAAFFVAPAALRAQGLTKIRVGGSSVSDIVGALYGVQSGIFQKYGLDVDIQRMNSSAAITAAVIGGSLDIGKATFFGLVVARSKGIPVVLEAPSSIYISADPDSGLVVAKNSPIQTARDLNGKVLASASLGDMYTTVNAAWIDQNGGDSRTVKYVELPGTATADAIVTGRVDAGTLTDPSLTEAVKNGKCRVIGHPEDILGNRALATAYFCSADFATRNMAAMTRFRKALDEATAYAIAHPSEMIPLVSKFSDVDPKLVKLLVLARAVDLLDSRLTQPTIAVAAKYKAIEKPFQVKEMIDPSVYSGNR